MTEIKVFPPTRTDTWDRCQLLDYLENRDRWVPKQATRKLVGGLAGRAFALGVSIIHQGGDPKEAGLQAAKSFEEDLLHNASHGVSFEASISEIVEASGIMATLPKYAAANPFKNWTIHDVERQLPDHGRCIIDLGGLDQDKVVSVADVKYKQNLEARWEQPTIDEYLTSWQFLHYPWAYGQYKKVPCYRMYLCLVVNKPKFYVKLIPHEVHPETQQIWLTSAIEKWKRMAQDSLPEMASRHKDMFGICPFYRACFDFHLDPALMMQEYVKVPDKRKVVNESNNTTSVPQ